MSSTDGLAMVVRRLWHNAAFRRVLPAFFLFTAAEYGTWVAILLFAYERTGPVSVGIVALIQLLPSAVVAPAAASLGDRYPRERVLALGYAGMAVAMALVGLSMVADVPAPVVYAIAAITGCTIIIPRPAQSSLLPSLAVTPDESTAANAASGMMEGAGILAGPLAAAAILTVSNPAGVFLAAAAALVLSVGLTVRLRPSGGLAALGDELTRDAPDLGPSGSGGGASESGARAGRDPSDDSPLAGLRAVLADPDARLVVGLLTARNVMVGAADVLFVLLALDLLGIGEPGAAVLSGALGAGAMVGGAATFTVVGRSRLAAFAALGALGWGLALAVLGLSASAWSAPWLVVIGGAGLAVVDIVGRTLLQRAIRDEVLSRVFGLQDGLAMAGLAAGSILVPVLAQVAGLVGAVVGIAALLPVLVGLGWTRLAQLDRRIVVPVREIALLRRTTLFRPLPGPQLEAAARRAVWFTLPAGAALIREGEPGDRFYVLASGRLRVEREGRHLRDIDAVGEGIGEIALLQGVPRTATVTTTADSTVLAIDRATFLLAVTGHPDAFAAAQRQVAARAM
jgi:MFS family permease